MVYFGVMRPLASYPVAVGVLATIALGLVLRTIVTLIWSAQTRYPAQFLGQFGRPVELLPGVTISGIDLLIIGAAVLAMIGFPILLRLSTIGIEMRGVAENAVLAAQRGINIHRINAMSWAAATIMAAVAGIFFSIKARLGPDIWYVGLAGFAPALIGGMDSLKGWSSARLSSPRRKFSPRSISRRRSRSLRRSWSYWSRCGSGRGVFSARAKSLSAYDSDAVFPRRSAPIFAAISSCSTPASCASGRPRDCSSPCCCRLHCPISGPASANQVFIAVIGALALNLLMGTTGQISLGHAGFVAAGAFTVAVLITHADAPIAVTLPAAAIVGAILGVMVGLPALRLKGLYLAVSTLAAHFVIIVGVGQYQSAISYGAGFTIPPPAFFGFSIGSERAWYFFLLPFALGVLLLNLNWLRSAYGRAWMAIRHRDIAAESLGINVALYKLLAFSASTSLTCVAGALWAYHTASCRSKPSTSTC